MKTMTAALGVILALAACQARAAESKAAKKFDAGPAIQGNSDPATPVHKKKAMKTSLHKKTL